MKFKKDMKIFQERSGLPYKLERNKGFSLVEVVVVVSIAAFSILTIWKVYTMYIKISLSNPSFFKASFLAEEGIEAIKFMRDANWSSKIATLNPEEPYALTLNGGMWSTTTAPSLIENKFDRRVVVTNVNRDVSGNINDSGVLDPNTKKVVVTVSWPDGSGTSTRQITTYVTNIFNN